MSESEIWNNLRERVESLAQDVHEMRRYLDEHDLAADGDLPGLLAAAANTLDWAVDMCEPLIGGEHPDGDDCPAAGAVYGEPDDDDGPLFRSMP